LAHYRLSDTLEIARIPHRREHAWELVRSRAGDGVTFRFGPFSLDSRTRQLLRDGHEVTLSPKAFQLLLLLVENRARAMSRHELHEQLWPSTFVLETKRGVPRI
jgi:DNA-binding response OmpR family regulator